MLIVRKSKLYYTASGIITLKKSEWSKITKIQFYKYENIVVKFICEFFICDYCVLLCITVYYCVLLCITVYYYVLLCITVYYCVLLCITVYYCVLLTINMLCHVEVIFIQLLNLLEKYYVYLHLCFLVYLDIKSINC